MRGIILHIPAPRRPKWFKRRMQAPPTPLACYIHLGRGHVETFSDKAEAVRWAQAMKESMGK